MTVSLHKSPRDICFILPAHKYNGIRYNTDVLPPPAVEYDLDLASDSPDDIPQDQIEQLRLRHVPGNFLDAPQLRAVIDATPSVSENPLPTQQKPDWLTEYERTGQLPPLTFSYMDRTDKSSDDSVSAVPSPTTQ